MTDERDSEHDLDDDAGDAAADESGAARPGDAGPEADAEGSGSRTGAGSAGAGKSGTDANDDDADRVDLKGIFRQLTAPMVESIDSRLREQVETHVDALLSTKVDAAVADRPNRPSTTPTSSAATGS